MFTGGIYALLIGYFMACFTKKNWLCYMSSFCIFLVGMIMIIATLVTYQTDSTDKCNRYGGHYVRDQRVIDNKGAVTEIYKCVKETE